MSIIYQEDEQDNYEMHVPFELASCCGYDWGPQKV